MQIAQHAYRGVEPREGKNMNILSHGTFYSYFLSVRICWLESGEISKPLYFNYLQITSTSPSVAMYMSEINPEHTLGMWQHRSVLTCASFLLVTFLC